MNEKFNKQTIIEDIKADVEKTNSWLLFSGIVLFLILIGFCVKTCAQRLDDSVQCIKNGGQWVSEEYKVITANEYSRQIPAYCGSKNTK